jgi:4-hydroxy-tetrahydrodipicolinate reductase
MKEERKKIHVCLVGAAGKMGSAILPLLRADPAFDSIIQVDSSFDPKKEGYTEIGKVNPEHHGIDVVINFTTPKATLEVIDWCSDNLIALVTGTTGLDEEQRNALKLLSLRAPFLNDSNMSLGVNLLDALLPGLAVQLVNAGFDQEIVELHHNRKKDSPSGTAKRFATTMANATGKSIAYGRGEGSIPHRGDAIFVHSVRGGTIAGEHTIYFLGPDEVIEIHHRALSNKIFALGAVRAAKWIIDKEPGLYSMLDVLGLKK